MKPKVIGWDVETFLIEAGNLTPVLVCLSMAGGADTLLDAQRRFQARKDVWFNATALGEWKVVVPRDSAVDDLVWAYDLVDVLVAHNGSFDWAVMVNECPPLIGLVHEALENGKIADSKVREQLVAIALDYFGLLEKPGFPLHALVMRRFQVDISEAKAKKNVHGKLSGNQDSWRLRFGELATTPVPKWPMAALLYAADDSVWARKVYNHQATPIVLDEGTVVNYDGTVVNELEQTRASWCLHLAAVNGPAVDPVAYEDFRVSTIAMCESVEATAKKLGFLKVNRCKVCENTGMMGSVPQLVPCPVCRGLDDTQCREQGIYKSRAVKPYKPSKHMKRLKAWVIWGYGGEEYCPKTKKGAIQTSFEVLNGMDPQTKEAFEPYLEGLQAIKWRDTYLPILAAAVKAGRLTSSPNALVRSGRTSWRNPNLQNPPRKGGFRGCFKARPGMVYASIDYSFLELCTLAQVCYSRFGFSRLREAINAGMDPHTAAAFFTAELNWDAEKEGLELTMELFIAWLEDEHHPRHKWAKNGRTLAKISNFGFPGGLVPKTFVAYAANYGVKVTLQQAEELHQQFFAAWTEMAHFFSNIESMLENDMDEWGRQRNRFDRRFTLKQLISGRLRGGCRYTSGANSEFQGLAADGMKHALWLVTKACYSEPDSPLYGCRVWNVIHDEFLIEGPEETAHIWAVEASRLMVLAMEVYTPDVKSKAPPALMRRWYKDADPVFDETGKLIPWEPAA